MRTKALLLAAAIGAVSLGTAMAQVYSVNIVGYVNTTVPVGWSIICNPLKASPDNTIANVIPNPGVTLNVYRFINSSGLYQSTTFDSEFGEWTQPGFVCDPGVGLFVRNFGTAPITITFVGEVPTGTVNIQIGQGFNLVASAIPQTGLLQRDLLYDPSHGVGTSDTVYKYVNATGLYQSFIYDGEFEEWTLQPTINVGEGFWILRGSAGTTWTRTFNVN